MQSCPTLEFYENMISQLGNIILMDRDSRFLLSNNTTAQMLGFLSEENMRGATPHDLRCPAVSSADEFREQDRFVVDNGQALNIISINTYALNETKLLLTSKAPFTLQGKKDWLLYQSTEINTRIVHKIIGSIVERDRRYHQNDSRERNYVIGNCVNNSSLSLKQLDCLFYLLRGYTMKETARRMGISSRSVENHIRRVKAKWRCPTRTMVIDHAVAHGFLSYLPNHLLPQGLVMIDAG